MVKKMPAKRNILLTGIPRSGTTLCCRLLNELEDTLALVEPFSVKEIAKAEQRKEVVLKISSCMSEARYKARFGVAKSKLYKGQIAENIIAEKNNTGTLRKEQIELGDISLDKPISDSGLLVVKHNAIFTALLDLLQKEFRVYALVRNPLSVLASWNSVDLPVAKGHVPAGELFCKDLKDRLDAEPEILSRQLIILDWFFQSYKSLPSNKVLRYENIVAKQHRALEVVTGKSGQKNLGVIENTVGLENQNSKYDRDRLNFLASVLLNSDGAYWDFYSRKDVESLLIDQ